MFAPSTINNEIHHTTNNNSVQGNLRSVSNILVFILVKTDQTSTDYKLTMS